MNGAWTWHCDRVFRSDPHVGREILDEVLEHLVVNHWDEQEVFGVHLAMEEALSNALKHGNGGDRSKHVRIRCCMSSDKVEIEITDEGRGFDPSAIPDPTAPENIHKPGGRGVKLMQSYMSDVRFNASGNQVLLEKVRHQ